MSLEGMRYNKGEWAELYVLLKLLGEGKLYAADSYLRKNRDSYLEVLSVLREEVAGILKEYVVADTLIDVIVDGVLVASIPSVMFLDNANLLFDYLLTTKGPSVPAPIEITQFSSTAMIEKPKSPAVRGIGSFGGKTDITLRARDIKTSVTSMLGFSIKSQFAQPPTLFNAGTGSQLLFIMHGMSEALADRFNALVDARGRRDWSGCMKLIQEASIDPQFIGCANEALTNNLLCIRESMADVLAWMYRERLLIDASVKTVSSLCEQMKMQNPLNYQMPWLYEKVVKDFLFASFSGMTGSRPWDGTEQVNGGYIVVLPTGEVLCYHASDREQFRDYLFRNTFIEYVSCKKYRWGYVELDAQGHYVLPVNAAIRFNKIPSKSVEYEYDGS